MDPSLISSSEDDLDEEDYEEHSPCKESTVLCHILDLKYLDNFSYSLIIDESTETLSSIRLSLNPQRRETLLQHSSFILDRKDEIRFSIIKDDEIIYISAQEENLPIRKLIETLNLSPLIKDEKLNIFLNKEDPNDTFVPPDPNEIFREFVQVTYSSNARKQQKIFIGKLEPEPELAILNLQGEEEWQFKVAEVNVDDMQQKLVQISYGKVQANFANVLLEFGNYEKKSSVMQCIGLVIEKGKSNNEEVLGVSRNYYVRKINRFGIKQKRIVWFEFKDSSFHISKLEKKNHQNFSIRFIKKFIKKLNTLQLDIEFYKEAKYKNLNLVFSNETEMEEFLEIAQKLQSSLRESKFQVKHSVIFAQDIAGLKRKRRSSWLNLQNSQEASMMNREDLFNYNVVVSGRVSQEKRYLVLDIDSAQVFLFSKEKKMIKKFDIENLAIRFYMNEPSKLELLCPKGNLDLVFPSVYTKYHFASTIISHKNPQKYPKTDRIIKNRAKVFTLTWNIGQKAEPSQSTLSLILNKAESSDIITLGFQECGKINIWLRELSNYLESKGFCLISYISMWDMFIVSYTRAQLLPQISDIKTCKKPTGIANLIGNKGGVLISFRLEDSSYCFLSCHLAARHNRLQLRNQNTRDLLTMRPSDPNIEFSVEFDYVFWLGDLNYRIDENFYEAIKLIDSGQLSELYEKDQLWLQMQNNKNLATFQEFRKNFKPTYRCSRTSQEWSNKREQTPSWTDRILFKAHQDVRVEFYEAVSECYGSDHRPVIAGFDTEYKVWFVLKELSMESQETLLGVIEIQNMEIEYFEETAARHAMTSFHSAFIEGSLKSSQVEMIEGKFARFDCKTLPMLTFIFANPNVLKELRVVLALWLVLNEAEVNVCGNSSMGLKDVVEFVGGLDLFDYTKKFETNAATKFEFGLELGSRVVGRVRGNWTFNVCHKSDQTRF